MKLTDAERDSVVTVLRCAADKIQETWVAGSGAICDVAESASYAGRWASTGEVSIVVGVAQYAYDRTLSKYNELGANGGYQGALLEAALLVEEGVLP